MSTGHALATLVSKSGSNPFERGGDPAGNLIRLQQAAGTTEREGN